MNRTGTIGYPTCSNRWKRVARIAKPAYVLKAEWQSNQHHIAKEGQLIQTRED